MRPANLTSNTKDKTIDTIDAIPIRRILILDDEASIVNAVMRELSIPPLGHYSYETEGFTDPVLALERAQGASFDAVICDYRMPSMDGLEFLISLRRIQPECARLVLSGQTDMEALSVMVNEAHIYHFIAKPWHDYYLKSLLARALDHSAAMAEHRKLASAVSKRNIGMPDLIEGAIDRILIVDDDPLALASLDRVLTPHSGAEDLLLAVRSEINERAAPILDEFRVSVHTAATADQALTMAAEVEFSCIVSDYKMPGMNGIDLLQKFEELQPDCARILISGVISQEDLIYAVTAAHIRGFIGKPWRGFELKATIAQALAWRRLKMENRTLAAMVKAGTENTATLSLQQ
jgi:DNA-binding NtrC family response regulator